MKIGEQIKLFRKNLGITQDELAEKIGAFSKVTIYQYESGKRMPDNITIEKIAKALNCTYIQKLEKK